MKTALQLRFRNHTYQLRFRWGFSLLCLFLFILCCMLGIWQLHRYAYKKNLLVEYQTRLHTKPSQWSEHPAPFQQIKVQGYYLNALTLLVQNRFYHDQLGFEVLTPFRVIDEKKLLLVDRGWIKKTNQTIPEIQPIKGQQNLEGYIKFFDEYQFILGENVSYSPTKQAILQRVDMTDIEKFTQESFYPFALRLNSKAPDGLIRDWAMTTMTPERHLAYALQWFAFATILLIAYFCFCCERQEP